MSRFQLNEWVLLATQKGKKWLVRLEEIPFSTHVGTIQLGDAVGREEGDQLETNLGAKLFLYRATLEDYVYLMKRQTQIIYPKDLAMMIFSGDLYPNCTVLESGIGSGGLSLALLRALCGQGRLISVEKRPEFAALAMENIAKFYGERPANHDVVVADIQDFHMTLSVDRVFLDLPEPWHAVKNIARHTRQGGILVSLSPNVGQVQLMSRELRQSGFASVSTFELLKRDWKVDEIRARPMDRMRAHTGFLTVAKKVRRAAGSQDVE